MTVELIEGDCREVLKGLDANSIDAIVTDPPYGLGFMGKDWDGADGFRRALNLADAGRDNAFGRTSQRGPEYRTKVGDMQVFQQWCTTWAVECLRVLKPGGHLLSFGGTRTYHRMASAIEDAGFEIRDQIGWLYGSGFPKSHNQHGEWEGWGTALKPAWEPIVLARKPLVGTVAANLAAHGVGAINIEDCRVEFQGDADQAAAKPQGRATAKIGALAGGTQNDNARTDFIADNSKGRWPANVIHDGSDEVLAAFPQARGQIADASSSSEKRKTQNVYGTMMRGNGREGEQSADSDNDGVVGFKMKPGARRGDTGSAARFFYCAKASKADRDDGVRSALKPVVTFATANGTSGKPSSISEGRNTEYRNTHPTVKPTDLMRYLCRLVTPPGGTVLDPFMGSGSTGRGAVLEGFNFIGIEMSAEYFDLADARIAAAEATATKTMQAAE